MLLDSEFNPGHLSWATRQGGGYFQGQCWVNDPQHVYKWDGLLVLRATTGNACGTGYESGAVYLPDYWFHYTYGWAAARIKVPCRSGFGVWPSWWQYDQRFSSNIGGEIDTMEEMIGPPQPARTVEQSMWSYGSTLAQARVTNSTPYCKTWHVFTNHWQPSKITFYVDGRRTRTVYESGHTTPESPVLSLLVGYWGGTPNPTTFPQSLLIDWVRIWK